MFVFQPLAVTKTQHSYSHVGENTTAPTLAWCFSLWATLDKERVHPLSSSSLPEPVLSVELSLTISSWYHSTFHHSSSSFPVKELTFCILRTSLCSQESANIGTCFCLLLGLQSTQPQCLSLGQGPGHLMLTTSFPSRSGFRRGPYFPFPSKMLQLHLGRFIWGLWTIRPLFVL